MRRFPPTGSGWILIAAAAVPIVIKAAKPLAKFIGEELEKIGKGIRESAAEAQSAPAEEPLTAKAAEPKAEPSPAKSATAEKPKPKPRKAPQSKPQAKPKSATKQGSKTVRSTKSSRRNGPDVETG